MCRSFKSPKGLVLVGDTQFGFYQLGHVQGFVCIKQNLCVLVKDESKDVCKYYNSNNGEWDRGYIEDVSELWNHLV